MNNKKQRWRDDPFFWNKVEATIIWIIIMFLCLGANDHIWLGHTVSTGVWFDYITKTPEDRGIH